MKLQHTLSSILLFIYVGMGTAMAVNKASDARLDEVERLGRQVMPFNLEQTLHVFSKTKEGGIQQVISKDPSNSTQITFIHQHLGKIAEDFKQGDFTDPIKIHGEDMPGLKALQHAKGAVSVQYKKLANGAEISYTTDDPDLIIAIHQWFDAQLSDHARHSTMHRQHHKMHEEKK